MASYPLDESSPYLIVGLGNPGPRYAHTRHNVGFMAVDELARRHGLRFSGGQANSEVAKGAIEGTRVVLAKPQTYMNESGRAVQSLAHYYKVPVERVLIVYDDFALPLGTLRIRGKGSAGGHNGLESIIRHLGTQHVPRLRIGVGGPPGGKHTHINWVLGRFAKDEQPIVSDVLSRAADAVESVFKIGMERTMNQFNTQGEKTESEKTEGSSPSAHRQKAEDGTAHASRIAHHASPAPAGNQQPAASNRTWADRVRDIIRRMGEGESE